MMKKVQAPSGLDQSRVPFSKRKLALTTRFLAVSSLFHCSQQAASVATVSADVRDRLGITLSGEDLLLPVYAEDGSDLR